MPSQNVLTTVQFTLDIPELPEAIQQEAESHAQEAYVMTLLRHGEISSGKAAKLLGISRLEAIELMGKYKICVFAPQTREELEQEVAETLSMLERNN